MSAENRIPVTILTGFLGAGKTTLLNRILSEDHGLRIAVIENEFGEIGIDHELVIRADEEIFETNNGCLCCTVRGDLIRILGGLAKRRNRFDHVLIETTGLADPGPVVQTFYMDEEIAASFFVNGVVTVVDAKHVGMHWDTSPEVPEQIAFADVILVNKTDLVSGDVLNDLTARVRSANPIARIIRSTRAEAPIADLLSIGGFSLDHAMELDPHFLDEEEEHGHHHHHHDDKVTSFALEAEGDMDEQKLNPWLSEFLQKRGAELFRMKGIFALKGVANRVVLQAVHMVLDAGDGGPWGKRPRKSIMVLIGRNLDRASLEREFLACRA